MRHPTNTAPYHARHSFHIPHHAALQHAIAPALHHGGNGAYLDTSQHSCTRHPCIYIACTFPMARRAASGLIPTCRASCSPHCSALRSACCSAFFAGCCTTARSRSRSGRASLLSQPHGQAQHRHCASHLLPLAELQQVERAILNSLIPNFRLAALYARHLTSSSATGRPEGYRGTHRSLALLQHRRLRLTNHQGDTRAAHRAAARVEALPLVSCPPATTGRV